MRILNVICSANPTKGGAIEWVRQFGLAAIRDGHKFEVVSLDYPNEPWMTNFPITLHPLGHQFKYFYSSNLVPWLRAHADEYDVIIAHGIWRFASYGTWLGLRNKSVPYFVYTHGMLDPWFKKAYPLKHLAKWLYWPWTDYLVLRDARGVIFTCVQEKLKSSKSFWLYRTNDIVSTLGISQPNCSINKAKDTFSQRHPELRGTDFLLFLGRIHPKKGCDALIHAFASCTAKNPNLRLVFAGPDDTNWIPHLKILATQYQIQDRITWAGMLSGDAKWGAFYSANAFILPSHQENFGIAVVEAMACGLPVLITNKVDIWQEIVDDKAGLVCDDNTPSIATMISEWLSLPDACKNDMRTNALHSFQSRFEITHATREVIDKLSATLVSD